MKNIVIIFAIVVAIIGGLVWAANNGAKSKESAITFADVKTDVASGAKLYDVRTSEEYTASHFEGAVNWSLQQLQAGDFPSVAKDAKIYVYCRSGNRSGQATVILKSAGYTNVVDLHGLSDVQAIGGTLITK